MKSNRFQKGLACDLGLNLLSVFLKYAMKISLMKQDLRFVFYFQSGNYSFSVSLETLITIQTIDQQRRKRYQNKIYLIGLLRTYEIKWICSFITHCSKIIAQLLNISFPLHCIKDSFTFYIKTCLLKENCYDIAVKHIVKRI